MVPAAESFAPSAITHDVAARIASIHWEELPDDIRKTARQCVLDWFGVTLAARGEPLVRILIDDAEHDGGRETATLVGRSRKVSARQAALINGAASHALDYDDVSYAMGGHPTVTILPGLIALAEERGAPGEALLAAFVAGHEAAGMIGLLVAPGHYDRGFHATATVGSFASAAACAHLLGLDEQATARALGIAGTQAAGLKAQFGTMCKPLHAGKAAENGLLASRLAARGLTSRTDILECIQGFAATQSADFNADLALQPPAGGFHVRNTLFKYNAACFGTHGTIEALRRLRIDGGLTPDRITAVHLHVEPGADRMCNIRAPATGLEAKFSLRFNAALSLVGRDTAAPETYSDAATADPDLVRLRDRVFVHPMSPGWSHSLTECVVELDDGRRLTARHDVGIPAVDVDEQGQRIRDKFMSIAGPQLGTDRARRLADAVDDLDAAPDIAGLMTLARL